MGRTRIAGLQICHTISGRPQSDGTVKPEGFATSESSLYLGCPHLTAPCRLSYFAHCLVRCAWLSFCSKFVCVLTIGLGCFPAWRRCAALRWWCAGARVAGAGGTIPPLPPIAVLGLEGLGIGRLWALRSVRCSIPSGFHPWWSRAARAGGSCACRPPTHCRPADWRALFAGGR